MEQAEPGQARPSETLLWTQTYVRVLVGSIIHQSPSSLLLLLLRLPPPVLSDSSSSVQIRSTISPHSRWKTPMPPPPSANPPIPPRSPTSTRHLPSRTEVMLAQCLSVFSVNLASQRYPSFLYSSVYSLLPTTFSRLSTHHQTHTQRCLRRLILPLPIWHFHPSSPKLIISTPLLPYRHQRTSPSDRLQPNHRP